MRKNYVNISIPAELIELIDKAWKNSKKGFRSRAEFVTEAIRDKIDKEKQIK